MPDHVDGDGVTFSVKVYERLLAAYPAEFRREYGPAMKQLFRDQCRDAWSQSRGRGLAILWLRVLPDLAKTSLVEHLATRGDARQRAAFTKWFVLVFVFMFVLSICQMFWTPKVYSSTTRIEVESSSPDTPNSFVATQFKIIKSYEILTNVIINLHLQDKLAAQAGEIHWTMYQTYAAIVDKISVEQTRMSSLIEIKVKNRDPKMAADIANAIVDAYRSARREEWKADHLPGVNALQVKLSDEKVKLGIMENDLKEMQAALNITGLDKEGAMASENRSYLSLKRNVEEPRQNNEELNRMIQMEADEIRGPHESLVIVRDPARPILRPVQTMSDIFLRWMLAGTLVALIAGGASAWLASLIQRSRRQRTL